MGNRLAEMQLRILWEEILKRFPKIEVVGEPVYVASPFTKGYGSLKVRIPPSETLAPRPAPAQAAQPLPPIPVAYRQPLSVLVAASLVSAAAALLFNVMPALLTAAATRFSLDAGQIGVVGSSYLAGFALVAATSNQWLGRFNWRALVAGGIRRFRRSAWLPAASPRPTARCWRRSWSPAPAWAFSTRCASP